MDQKEACHCQRCQIAALEVAVKMWLTDSGGGNNSQCFVKGKIRLVLSPPHKAHSLISEPVGLAHLYHDCI